MKNFTRRGYLIVNATRDTKLIYTFFLVFSALGFVTIASYQMDVIGWGLSSIRAHYLGDPEAMMFPKEFLQLLETSHAHTFMMGLVYLTLAHIVIATRISSAWKLFLVVTGFLFTLFDLVSPWLIRYAGSEWSIVLLISWIGMWLVYLSYLIIPFIDMWLIAPPPEE